MGDRAVVRRAADGSCWLALSAPLAEKWADGEMVRVSIEENRSHEQHRLFWAMLRHVAENSDRWESPEETLLWLKTQMGLYRAVKLGDRTILDFKSVSFRAMGAKRFKDFLDRAVKVLSEHCGFDPLSFYDGESS